MRPGLHLNNLGRWMNVLFQFCERRNRINRWESMRRQHKNVRQDGWPNDSLNRQSCPNVYFEADAAFHQRLFCDWFASYPSGVALSPG